MSNSMSIGSTDNKEEVCTIRATDEQISKIAEYISDEFNEDYDEQVASIKANPSDVGLLYTTFDEYDENDEYVEEHDIQICADLCRLVYVVYVDAVKIHEETICEDDYDWLDFQSLYDYFVDIAREHLPTAEQIANEHNPYMEGKRALLDIIERNGGSITLKYDEQTDSFRMVEE